MKTFKFCTILLFATMFANCAFAQVNEDEICFYGKNANSRTGIYTVKFEYLNDRVTLVLYSGSPSAKFDPNRRSYDPDFFEKDDWWNPSINRGDRAFVYEYDSDLSNQNYEVYKRYNPAGSGWDANTFAPTSWPAYYRYVAFSKDLSVMIRWYENVGEAQVRDKVHWYRIPKENFIPGKVSANHDFLND